MNLDSTLRGYDDTLAKTPSDMPGEIGAVINGKRRTNVVGRGGFVYVRLRTNLSEPIQAYNDKVFPGFGVAVIVRWVNNRYEIVGRDSQRYQEWETDTPEISKHGNSHSLDVEGGNIGTDPAWIYPYQFIPGLVSPYNQSGAQNVYVHPFPILYGGEWLYAGNTGTPSLIAYSPTSGTVFVLITVDAETGNPALFATTGTYVTWNISGSNQYVPYLPNVDIVRYLPLSFAILQSGTTSMSWSNLRDVRQWISTSQSGTSGGGASLAFQDEGVPLGTPGTVNFVGGNVSVTISGTVARVFVTGSSGGATDHNSLTGLQGGTGSQYYHLSYPEWGGLITGSLTYLHKHSAADIVTGTMATARLGSGFATGTTALFGDQSYKEVVVPTVLRGRHYLPFGVFGAISPMAVTSDPYAANIDRTMTPKKLSYTGLVLTTNDGSNYWKIDLYDIAGNSVATVNTSTWSASTWSTVSTTSFSISPLTTSNKGIFVEVSKVGSPGNLYLFGPLFEVEIA